MTKNLKRILVALAMLSGISLAVWWAMQSRGQTQAMSNQVNHDSPAAQKSVAATVRTADLSAQTSSVATKQNVSQTVSKNSSAAAGHRLFASATTAKAALALIEADPAVLAGDKRYFQALISELCSNPSRVIPTSKVTEQKTTAVNDDSTETEQRQRARRILQQRKITSFCEGMPVLSAEEQARNWELAAASGDLRARGRLKWAQFEAAFESDPFAAGNPNATPDQFMAPKTWTPDMLSSIAQALGTKDPSAIMNFGGMLQQTSHSNYVALTETGESLADLPMGTWAVLACAYGARCGSDDNSNLLARCANEGRCDINSFEDHMRQNVWTGAEASQFDAIRPYLIQLIETGEIGRLSISTFDATKPPVRRNYTKGPRRSYPPA
jgi:hypothetical protein